MISRTHAKQITQNRLNLERSARIKHNPQFDQRPFITSLALMIIGGVQ
jgi:hypothetical protein